MLTLTCDGLPDLDLEDAESGLVCTSFDFGWPDPREYVVTNPGQSGTVDLTSKHSARAVSLELSVSSGTGGARADLLDRLAPFMHPARRPVLHYVDSIDGGNVGTRQVTLAPRGLSTTRTGEVTGSVQAQFVAPDGLSTTDTAIVLRLTPLSSAAAGRSYPLTYSRTYPTATASLPLTVPVFGHSVPHVTAQVYGACTEPELTVTQDGETWTVVKALSSYTLAAGDYLEIDMQNHTVLLNGNPGSSRFEFVDHAVSTWRLPMPGTASLSFTATAPGGTASLVIYAHSTFLL